MLVNSFFFNEEHTNVRGKRFTTINGGRRDRLNRGCLAVQCYNRTTVDRTTRLTWWAGGREGCRTRIAGLPLAQNGVCLCGWRRGISYNRRRMGPCWPRRFVAREFSCFRYGDTYDGWWKTCRIINKINNNGHRKASIFYDPFFCLLFFCVYDSINVWITNEDIPTISI